MDGISLYTAIREASCLIGGKIDKVRQPGKDALLFVIRNEGKNHNLYISVNAENGRLQLTKNEYENPAEPPMFCMLLRKRLIGGRITEIRQRGTDRYFVIGIRTKNELDDTEQLELHVELMGKHSDITLVENGTILDAIRRVTPSMSSVRLILPGISYTPPPEQEKRSPFTADETELAGILASPTPGAALQARFGGLSRESARVLTAAYPDAGTLCRVLQAVGDGTCTASVVRNGAGSPASMFPFPLPEDYNAETFDSLWEAGDAFYRERDRVLTIGRNASALKQSIELMLKRRQSKLAKYREAILESNDAGKYRKFGDLLTANLYAIKRGQSAVKLLDYFADPPAEAVVPLDPLLTPNANAQAYYKKYRRKKAAGEYAEKMLREVEEEVTYFEGALDDLNKCASSAELNEIREEMTALGYLKRQGKRAKPANNSVSKPLCFAAPDGSTIWVGKNNKQNEQLTLKKATGETMWLHVKNIPGSHVIIEPEGQPSDETLALAAELAAFYSKARGSASVPVDYTFRKFIKKPSGSKPGMVIYSTNRTLYVTPDEGRLRSVLTERRTK
ncbi:MAG: NFACT RNA binding domain-containing protein [Clostridia bacterium]|nr:NFACT RNA binding domain-containing protein [Clostridia bacterium]